MNYNPISKRFFYLIVVVLCGFFNNEMISAQTTLTEGKPLTEGQLSPNAAIMDMHKNIVLVRLATANRYLVEIETLINDTTITERQRQNLRIARARKIENRDFFNQMMIAGFSFEFNFASKAYFFNDTSSVAVKAGMLDGHVFDSNGTPVQLERFEHKIQPYYVVLGVQDPTNGIAVHDSDFNPIQHPFPGFVSAWHEKPGFLYKAFEILYSGRFNAVSKLNRHLWKYYGNALNQ